MIRKGELLRFAVVDGFSPPPVYLRMLLPIPPTGEPSLDALRKPGGEGSWNHTLYTRIGKERMQDALAGLTADPVGFIKVLTTSLYHFNRLPSEFKGLERNRAAITDRDRFGNAVVGLQTAAWLGGAMDPGRPSTPLLRLSGTEVVILLFFIALGGSVSTRFFALLRAKAMPDALLTTEGMLLLLGGWVIMISSSFDVWENNRARFDIGPLLLIGALIMAIRLTDRRASSGCVDIDEAATI